MQKKINSYIRLTIILYKTPLGARNVMVFTTSCRSGCTNIGNGVYENFMLVSGYFCNRLFSIGEMVSKL